MTDFVNWNVKHGQQGTGLLSSRLFRKVNCGFQCEKLQIGTQFDKKPKFFILESFYAIVVEILTDFAD